MVNEDDFTKKKLRHPYPKMLTNSPKKWRWPYPKMKTISPKILRHHQHHPRIRVVADKVLAHTEPQYWWWCWVKSWLKVVGRWKSGQKDRPGQDRATLPFSWCLCGSLTSDLQTCQHVCQVAFRILATIPLLLGSELGAHSFSANGKGKSNKLI